MRTPPVITEQSALMAQCDAWRAGGRIAFDTEFIRDDTYHATLCLIQVAAGDEVVLIDPTVGIDVRVFWELVADPNVLTIVHAGKEDFEVCLRQTGLVPRNVFDVQIAAGFVGYGYPLSLSRLVEGVLGLRISKGQTLTDWLRRPLTPAQLRYAVEDVLHLNTLCERLSREIEKLGRTNWVAEEFRALEDRQHYRLPAQERALRLKGSKKLDALGLAVLEKLVEWRERWAQSRNRPIRALVRDDILVEIARRRPQQESDLEVLRGFPQARNRTVVREILDIITTTAKTPPDGWPQPYERREDAPMVIATLDLLAAILQAVCHEERLSRNLLGGTQRLRELLDHHTGRNADPPELLRGWRKEFIGQRLIQVLEGRREVLLTGWPHEPRFILSPPDNTGSTSRTSSASAARRRG